jgi:hypothetical protein
MIHIKLRATVRSGRNLCGCRTFDRTAGGGDAGAEPIEQGEAAMKSRLKLNVLAAALAGAAVLGVPAAFADAHGHGATEVHKLTLNQGKKWATDEPLRKGMAEIRTLVEAQYTGIHKGTLKSAAAITSSSDVAGAAVGAVGSSPRVRVRRFTDRSCRAPPGLQGCTRAPHPRRARFFGGVSGGRPRAARITLEALVECTRIVFLGDRCEALAGPRVEIPERGVR